MVGEVGKQIEEFAVNDPDILNKLSTSQLKVLITMGNVHRNLTDKLVSFGINVQEEEIKETTNPANKFITESIKAGRIDGKRLEQIVTSR